MFYEYFGMRAEKSIREREWLFINLGSRPKLRNERAKNIFCSVKDADNAVQPPQNGAIVVRELHDVNNKTLVIFIERKFRSYRPKDGLIHSSLDRSWGTAKK